MPQQSMLLVDCDTGIDDALALLYLLRTPAVDLRAVTTVGGNTTAARAAMNTLQVLELAGRQNIPVGVGAERSLAGSVPCYAPEVHGRNGLGDVALPDPRNRPDARSGVDLIVDTARDAAGELMVLALAPLTNLALALRKEPKLAAWVRHVIVMGGAIHHPGNGTPAAEANIGNDPEAAALVFAAGWTLTLVPLDVTMGEIITEDQRGRLLDHGSPVCRFAGDILDTYFAFHYGRSLDSRGGACHDPLAAAVAVGDVVPRLAPRVHLMVDTADGTARGATVADTRGRYRGYPASPNANATVVLETDGNFPTRLVERLCS